MIQLSWCALNYYLIFSIRHLEYFHSILDLVMPFLNKVLDQSEHKMCLYVSLPPLWRCSCSPLSPELCLMQSNLFLFPFSGKQSMKILIWLHLTNVVCCTRTLMKSLLVITKQSLYRLMKTLQCVFDVLKWKARSRLKLWVILKSSLTKKSNICKSRKSDE